METGRIRIAVLCGLLLLVGGISRIGARVAPLLPEREILSTAVKTQDPWVPVMDITIEKNILDELKLDDHLFRAYTNGKQTVTLYIGYYGTSRTVGAAHDPLVCFPGQGWVISDQKSAVVRLQRGGEQDVNYSVMTATKGENKELILYWFQSHGDTASGTASQKINTLIQKMKGKRGRNAFVRISVPIGQTGTDDARRLAIDFLVKFYPSFFEFIRT